MAKEINLQNFEATVDSNPIVILDFWAEWCGPCKTFGPIFDHMAETHTDVFFGKVNTEESKDLAEAFQIRSIPTLMAFIKGELVFEQAGLVPPQIFEQLIGKLKDRLKELAQEPEVK